MKLLRDIVCTSTPYGETYTDDYLTGSIVIYGDKLEGMVYDDASSYLVFGEIYPEDIKVVVCTDHDERLPKMYEGMLDGNKYYGDKSVLNRFEGIPYEECKVWQERERYREYAEHMTAIVENHSADFFEKC